MKKRTKEASQLIGKYLAGQCTPEETAFVETWFNEQSNRMVTEMPAKPRYARLPGVWITIAALLIAVCTVAYLLVDPAGHPAQPHTHATDATVRVLGTATLALANGTTLALDTAQAGIVIAGDEVRYSDGSVLPLGQQPASGGSVPKSEVLVLSTSRGGQYQVTLGDGTRVWLNAASTLTYPTYFTGDTRTVELDGEAYFEVKSSTKPFIVRTSTQEAVVLGTSFNISAYGEDSAVKTTLLTGALNVRQTGKASNQNLTLAPHEQSVNTGSALTKTRVDVAAAVAWRAGRFSFDGKTFRQIMAEMARWYDIDVIYEGDVPDERFIGGTFRDQELTIVHSFLESAGVTYRMLSGKTLVIHDQKHSGRK